MSFRQVLVAAAVISVAAFGSTDHAGAADLSVQPQLVPADHSWFLAIDNRVTFAFMPTSTYPGYYSKNSDGSLDGKTAKKVLAFTHFDAWAYGTNLLNIVMSKSDHNDPAAPCVNAGLIFNGTGLVSANCAGATSVYGQLRSTFGWNEIFDTKVFTIGRLHNISFEIGADAQAVNDYNSGAKRGFMAGLQFAFDLPYKGYINVAPMVEKEINHSGYLQCGGPFAGNMPGVTCLVDGNTNFPISWTLETNYYMELGFLPESIHFWAISGRAAWLGAHGNQNSPLGPASGGVDTKVNLDSEPIRLTFDAGKAIWGPKYTHFIDLWAAYRYAQNKGSNDHLVSTKCVVGGISNGSCTESTLYTGITLKF
jgi:hypothetical protein